jgi:hypothetical protein
MSAYNKDKKRWYVTYSNAKDEVINELQLNETEIIAALVLTQEKRVRLSSNAGDKRRKVEGDLIGRVVSKRFPNRKKPYLGKVVSYSNDENDNEYYKIEYNSDDDSEEMTEKEVEKILVKE